MRSSGSYARCGTASGRSSVALGESERDEADGL